MGVAVVTVDGPRPDVVVAAADTARERGCVCGLAFPEREGGLGLEAVEVRVEGVEPRVGEMADTLPRSSLGISNCTGNGVWTVTTGVRLSAFAPLVTTVSPLSAALAVVEGADTCSCIPEVVDTAVIVVWAGREGAVVAAEALLWRVGVAMVLGDLPTEVSS